MDEEINGCVDPTESCEPWDEPPGKDTCELRPEGRPEPGWEEDGRGKADGR